MKKIFYFLLAMLMTPVMSYALSEGDYFYTLKGRYKVVGENLISNGDFADTYVGWQGITGGDIDANYWSVEPAAGPNGENAIMSIDATDNSLARSVQLEGGKIYVVSFDAKASAPLSTGTTAGGSRYLGIYTNQTGAYDTSAEGYRLINGVKNITTEWQTFTDTIDCQQDEYLQIVMQYMSAEAMFTNFAVTEAQQIADDRQISEIVAYAKSLIENPDFPNGHEDFQELIEEMESMKESEDIELVNEMMIVFDDVINIFLEENTANATNYIKNANFDDITSYSAVKSDVGYVGAWYVTGARWRAQAARDGFTTTFVNRNCPGKNNWKDGTISQKIDLPAGKYMFTMNVMARMFTPTKSSSTIDESMMVDGIKLFANNDSVSCDSVQLYRAKRYYVTTTISQGDSLNVGLFVPGNGSLSAQYGQDIYVDLTDVRWIGGTEEELAEYVFGKELGEAKMALKSKIAEAQEFYNSDEYIFCKALLADSIAVSQKVLNNSLEIDTINNQTKRLTRAITYYKTQNLEYTTLNSTIAEADEIIADETYKTDKANLIAVDTDAKNYVASLTVESERDSLTLTTHTNNLVAAMEPFIMEKSTTDEMYTFYTWAQMDGAVYESQLADTCVYTSCNKQVFYETAPFAGNSFGERIAFTDNAKITRTLEPDYGFQLAFSGKNSVTMAIMNLKKGDKVTLDWTMANTSHTMYIQSPCAQYTKDDGTVVTLTNKEKDANNNLSPTANANGINGFCRTVVTMTDDGSLDIYQGNSGSTLRVSYIGVEYDKGGLKGDANNDGIIDVADITIVASYILGNSPKGFNADNADANSDDKIDVADITTIAGIILN